MILEKEQIQRYMRHIIMPEISGKGQKKLLEASALLYAENAGTASTAVYYAAAAGIGRLCCCFDDKTGCEELLNGALDLNPDTAVVCIHGNEAQAPDAADYTFRIILGSISFVKKTVGSFAGAEMCRIPTITAVTGSWKGIVITCTASGDLSELYGMPPAKHEQVMDSIGNRLSSCFAGALAVIEGIKACIGIGKPASDGLYYDMLEAVYENIRAGSLDKHAKMLCEELPMAANLEEFTALKQAKVLVVGSGGLGSPIAYALAASGIGTIGLMDYDRVDISNLNRQIMHSTGRIGMPKVESAKMFLNRINPAVETVTYDTAFSRENAMDILSGYDVIADGLDNLPTRYLLNDACHFAGKPFVEAGVLGFLGLATVVVPGSGPCYRCIFPESSDNSNVPSCAETGVLGPVPGVLGFVQAAEIIKLLTGKSRTLKGRILSFDALEPELYLTSFDRSDKCVLCGAAPTITELGDYKFVCESK